MGITAFPFSSVIDVPTARILGRDDAGTGAAEALTNAEVFAILATGTPSASTYLRGDGTWSTISAGVSGSTGSTDNAVLRADGTGGATLQASAVVIPDNFTASPNATVNHASIQATGDTTNVSVSVVPKGTGSFSLQVPDGTSTGGNARGVNAADLQTARSAASQVAGNYSIIAERDNVAAGTGYHAVFGYRNTASGSTSLVVGEACSATGSGGIVAGNFSSSTSTEGFAVFGRSVVVSGNYGIGSGYQTEVLGTAAAGFGDNARARLAGEFAHASGRFAANGDCQRVAIILRGKTTTNAAVELVDPTRFVIPAGFIFHGTVRVSGAKSDGSAVAAYERQLRIKRVGNTTSLVGTVNTIGTDEAAGTSLSITADDTNESAKIEPTGVLSETWRWEAVIEGGLYAYGT